MVVQRSLEIGSVAIVLVGEGPKAEATCWQRARAHMLFGRRGARTAVARASAGCVSVGDCNGSTGWMDRDVRNRTRTRQGNWLLTGTIPYYSGMRSRLGAASEPKHGLALARMAGLRMQSSLIDSIPGMNTISGEASNSLEAGLRDCFRWVCWSLGGI